MSDTTGIAWTNATWNPVTGCSKVSPGCAHCYAETLALTRLAGREGYPGLPWTPENAERNVVLHDDRLDLPLHWRKPRRVFVNSMSDLFHERVPVDFLCWVFSTMAITPRHTYQVLTKRPERAAAVMGSVHAGTIGWKEWPLPNVWLGTSIENDRFVGRADDLRRVPGDWTRFISAEPLLGPLPSLDLTGIDWLIVGGESGPGYRAMDPAWVRDLVDRADVLGCAVFVKQDSGARSGRQGRLPDDLWARKEYPA